MRTLWEDRQVLMPISHKSWFYITSLLPCCSSWKVPDSDPSSLVTGRKRKSNWPATEIKPGSPGQTGHWAESYTGNLSSRSESSQLIDLSPSRNLRKCLLFLSTSIRTPCDLSWLSHYPFLSNDNFSQSSQSQLLFRWPLEGSAWPLSVTNEQSLHFILTL